MSHYATRAVTSEAITYQADERAHHQRINMSTISPVKAFISTVPFGESDPGIFKLLNDAGIEYEVNPYGRKITSSELATHLAGCMYHIAGTEQITPAVLDASSELKLIARVGVGLDNVPFEETKKRGISVAYTPDAPTRAVAELVIGLMLDGLRCFSKVDREMRNGRWNKHMGGLLEGRTIGICGVGRIGKSVVTLLSGFNVSVLGYDLQTDERFAISRPYFRYCSKQELLSKSDVISLNISYSDQSIKFIGESELRQMKPGAILINTSRGSFVDEMALSRALQEQRIAGAALDVFEEEPYTGPLLASDRVILTAHIGAATHESRARMEREAVEEVVRFHKGEGLLHPVDRY